MKRALLSSLLLALVLCLLASCGGESKADAALDKYIEVAELYSSLTPTIAGIGDTSVAAAFSEWGVALSDYGSQLERDVEAISDEELDSIVSALDNIQKELSALSPADADEANADVHESSDAASGQ